MASFSKKTMIFFMVVVGLLMQISIGAVYKVGDDDGWTALGGVDYEGWAGSKTFHVGDTIVFEYSAERHNVLEVTKEAYESCDATTPLATYATGKDSITIKKSGHHFFLCGVTGHCEAGQKVDFNVVQAATASPPSSSPTTSVLPVPETPPPTASPPSSSPTTSVLPVPETPPPTPTPTVSPPKSGASLPSTGFLFTIIVGLAIFVRLAYN
ncbi:hypothetical protein GIB67_009981 [Kingdonia uniflora]|uniref:Phytocyanin domain-containing protein n=1 Tax=Kingdonia uniflora TaxID=39325 RepID=A0A7J7L9C2_9MAGN|nr:hypothetical protein GIB67_009981 [Kingdonia uniflora]